MPLTNSTWADIVRRVANAAPVPPPEPETVKAAEEE